jgi:DNA-binding NarL/FixJ family response regulator
MVQNVSIVVADAQILVRRGLRSLLEGHENFRIVAEAATEQELEQALLLHPPQVVILDYNQPNFFTSQSLQLIKTTAPGARVLVISADSNKQNIYQVLESGVHSFLTKTCGEEEVIDAVKATAKGEKFFCSRVLDYILERSFPRLDENCARTPLTTREIEIVKLVAKGLIAKEIADALNLSTHTVYTHRKNIMKKLQLSSASELVLYAVHHGILDEMS